MKKIATLGVTTFVMTCMMLLSTVSVMAGMNEKVELPANQVWTKSYPSPRTGDYSRVWANCDSVYPSSGTDHFKTIQVRILNNAGTVIMDKPYESLTEGDDAKAIYIKEGYLGTTTVNFQFRGNNNSAATAIVDYWCN